MWSCLRYITPVIALSALWALSATFHCSGRSPRYGYSALLWPNLRPYISSALFHRSGPAPLSLSPHRHPYHSHAPSSPTIPNTIHYHPLINLLSFQPRSLHSYSSYYTPETNPRLHTTHISYYSPFIICFSFSHNYTTLISVRWAVTLLLFHPCINPLTHSCVIPPIYYATHSFMSLHFLNTSSSFSPTYH